MHRVGVEQATDLPDFLRVRRRRDGAQQRQQDKKTAFHNNVSLLKELTINNSQLTIEVLVVKISRSEFEDKTPPLLIVNF
ncbi:hypothetical protein AGMMS49959_09110 [Planctomycetales bacterium]|nr:hypothetical protein AGMMS49959_09110 [Planctomycetales bacterium]